MNLSKGSFASIDTKVWINSKTAYFRGKHEMMQQDHSLINKYLEQINTRYKTGISREHSYRGDLQNLLTGLNPNVLITNEPARVECGAPDYIITVNDIPVGYIEAKDIGKPLNSKEYKEQFDRYRSSLTNLIITDYLNFWLYVDGELVTTTQIGEIYKDRIKPMPTNYDGFAALYRNYSTFTGQTITSASKLAQMMAAKARLLADIITNALTSDEENQSNTYLQGQMQAFKDVLIHDIKPKEFADLYAQTIAYGMFAARLHDTTLDDFSRQEAAQLIPHSNPFLRKLFQDIAGYDLDDRIRWIVDALADVFRATDVAAILKNFGKATQQNDPIIHFYETFLAEYDPKLRKSRGVWYTPEPVVKFIVRAVDDILKTEFNLPEGLADTAKTKIKVGVPTHDKRSKTGYTNHIKEVHKVQILDPATGTGTFLAEVVKHIYKIFQGQQGIWSAYVEQDLLPRLNGFELLMASYAMAHLKLDLLLTETGFKPSSNQRFRVYLTNSLEEHHQDTGTLFANWLSTEANEANHIKRDTPVMCVIGNPPYSGLSVNQGKWIKNLIEDYKYVDGKHFGERKHWLNDDYVKFIRYGQYYIEKNGSGVLAFINPHGFRDNPTFRGMRWNLLQAFDKIYTLDLHGNSNKIEESPDGSPDINVFDIQQGVSINIFIKTGQKKTNTLGDVFTADLYGKRDYKYNFLMQNDLSQITFKKAQPNNPYYFFVSTDNNLFERYEKGLNVADLISNYTVGCVTANDGLNISFTKKEQESKIEDLLVMQESEWRIKYNRKKDSRDWTYQTAKKDANENNKESNYTRISYRPFDARWTLYTGNSRGLYSSPQPKIMRQFLNRQNLGLVTARSNKSKTCDHFFISNLMMETKCGERTTQSAIFPLYIYPDNNGQQSIEQDKERKPNLKVELVKRIAQNLNLIFTSEKVIAENTFAPVDILDYIYAILHSPTYRMTYKEFLKVDFPRVPYPKEKDIFWQLVKLGSEIRRIHLLESPKLNLYITQYPIDGDNVVDKLSYVDSKVFINETQYFDNVPQLAWNFYIGGYQPAQKWLKDRKGRQLTFDDIRHYQKIIVALVETDRLMKEIDPIVKNAYFID